MTSHDAQRFGVAMFALAELFGEALSETRLGLYFRALSDLSIEAVEAAVETCMQSCKFFPRPVDIREAVLGSASEQAMLAWSRVLAAIRHYGSRSSVDFGDPLVHVTVESLGGWHALAAEMPSDPQEQAFRMHDFLKRYRGFAVKIPGTVPNYLPGLCEIENRSSFGGWTRGLGHRDEVLTLGPDGAEVLAKRPALPSGPPRMRLEMGKLLRLPPPSSESSERSA